VRCEPEGDKQLPYLGIVSREMSQRDWRKHEQNHHASTKDHKNCFASDSAVSKDFLAFTMKYYTPQNDIDTYGLTRKHGSTHERQNNPLHVTPRFWLVNENVQVITSDRGAILLSVGVAEILHRYVCTRCAGLRRLPYAPTTCHTECIVSFKLIAAARGAANL
jgi:hypothetical protein